MEQEQIQPRVAQVWDWPLQHNDGLVNVTNNDDRFECELEVTQFKADEIDVKIMRDELVLHCSQDRGTGRMPREIHRTYHLPPDVDMGSVKTSLGGDGHLKVTASKKR